MASKAGKNKSGSGSTGLKILWIPGRKKHHDKGVYRPTKNSVEHKHGEKKNEVWNLGGSKSHDEILSGADKDDKLDCVNPSTPINSVLPTASLGATTVNVDECSGSDSEIKLAKNDFDSIENLDDLDGQPKLSSQNGKANESNATSKKSPKSCEKKKEEKTVKCLYYTMMCCECTIS